MIVVYLSTAVNCLTKASLLVSIPSNFDCNAFCVVTVLEISKLMVGALSTISDVDGVAIVPKVPVNTSVCSSFKFFAKTVLTAGVVNVLILAFISSILVSSVSTVNIIFGLSPDPIEVTVSNSTGSMFNDFAKAFLVSVLVNSSPSIPVKTTSDSTLVIVVVVGVTISPKVDETLVKSPAGVKVAVESSQPSLASFTSPLLQIPIHPF